MLITEFSNSLVHTRMYVYQPVSYVINNHLNDPCDNTTYVRTWLHIIRIS